MFQLKINEDVVGSAQKAKQTLDLVFYAISSCDIGFYVLLRTDIF